MRFLLVLTALLALFAPMIYGADWVVIVVGSSTFDNYRHQADGCHAYQVVHKFGVPDSNIITMMYDDVASDPSNPFPGKLFNKPANTLAEAVDVYHKCKIDYRGEDVNAANFLSVLTGNSTGVPKGKPVLKSTSSDRVFINFVDHGGSGIIAMPTGPYVYAADLINALKTMHSKKMYSKAALYFEACEAGSMFENILPSNLNIYATTAANADESSYGDYCAPSDTVNGVEIGSCLGDLYSTNWLENSDAAGESETLLKQITTVIAETTESHVMQYGTLSFTNLPIGDFQGNLQGRRSHQSSHKQSSELKGKSSTLVNSRDISLHNKYYRYIRSVKSSTPNELSARALTELNNELNARKYADTLFDKLAAKLSYTINGSSDGSSFFALPKKSVTEGTECQKNVDNAFDKLCGGFTDYSLKYHRVVVNACHQTNDDTIINILKDVCASLQSNMIQL